MFSKVSSFFGFNSDPNPNATQLNQFMQQFVPDSSKLTNIGADGVYEIKGKVNLAMLDMLNKHLDNSGKLDNSFLSELRQTSFTSDPIKDKEIQEKAANIAKDIFKVSTPRPSPVSTPVPSRSSRTTNEIIGFNGQTYTAKQEKAFNIFIKRFARNDKASLRNLIGDVNKQIGEAFLNSLDPEGRLKYSQFIQSGVSNLSRASDLCDQLFDENLLERYRAPATATTTTTTTTTTITPSVASASTIVQTDGVSIADLNADFANYSNAQRDVFNLFIRAVKNDPTASITNIPNDPITKRMSNSFFKSVSSLGAHNVQQFRHEMELMENGLKANQVDQFEEMMKAYSKLMKSGQMGTV